MEGGWFRLRHDVCREERVWEEMKPWVLTAAIALSGRGVGVGGRVLWGRGTPGGCVSKPNAVPTPGWIRRLSYRVVASFRSGGPEAQAKNSVVV